MRTDQVVGPVPSCDDENLRIAALENRVARLEREAVPADYGCVLELVSRVETLEATVWELERRVSFLSAGGEPP